MSRFSQHFIVPKGLLITFDWPIVGPGKLDSSLELLVQRETEGRGAQNEF